MIRATVVVEKLLDGERTSSLTPLQKRSARLSKANVVALFATAKTHPAKPSCHHADFTCRYSSPG